MRLLVLEFILEGRSLPLNSCFPFGDAVLYSLIRCVQDPLAVAGTQTSLALMALPCVLKVTVCVFPRPFAHHSRLLMSNTIKNFQGSALPSYHLASRGFVTVNIDLSRLATGIFAGLVRSYVSPLLAFHAVLLAGSPMGSPRLKERGLHSPSLRAEHPHRLYRILLCGNLPFCHIVICSY